QNHSKKLCQLVSEIHESENKSKGQKTSSHKRRRRVPIRPEHFKAQQKMDFSRLLSSLERIPTSRLLTWVPRVIASRSCPRNLSAAAIRRLESALPGRQVRVAIEKLYNHAATCLKPSDDAYEITHFRQALLRHLWGHPKDAK